MADYTARYGLEFNPFTKNAKDILLEAAESSEVHTRPDYLKDTRGFGVLTGEPGRGKATAAGTWASSLSPSLPKVPYSSLSSLTVMDFYRQVAAGPGAEPRFRKNELFEGIQRGAKRYAMGKRVTPVAIIDEADMLSHKVLSDLQIMFSFETDSGGLAAVLLAGQPGPNTTLNQSTHESPRQRIVMNYRMAGISKEEGRKFIIRKLEGAGSRQAVFGPNAAEAILNAAGGTPRMASKLCNRSLMVGASQNQDTINADTVRKAIEDNQLGQYSDRVIHGTVWLCYFAEQLPFILTVTLFEPKSTSK